MRSHTFPKRERLNKTLYIQELFKTGSSFYLYPFKVIYRAHPEGQLAPRQILIAVPARNFKRAVDRNLLKRRIREAYRINKHMIAQKPRTVIAYVYTAKEILDFDKVADQLIKTFDRLPSA